VDRFFLLPALLDQQKLLRLVQAMPFLQPPRLAQCQLRQHIVKIVAAQRRQAFTGQHLKRVLLAPHQGNVERTASEIVHQHRLRLLHAHLPVAEFHGRRGRFVHQRPHVETGPRERLNRQVALVGIG
jgi:chemotaxis regulatin CheY-phosphate phosphatase CheZ